MFWTPCMPDMIILVQYLKIKVRVIENRLRVLRIESRSKFPVLIAWRNTHSPYLLLLSKVWCCVRLTPYLIHVMSNCSHHLKFSCLSFTKVCILAFCITSFSAHFQSVIIFNGFLKNFITVLWCNTNYNTCRFFLFYLCYNTYIHYS